MTSMLAVKKMSGLAKYACSCSEVCCFFQAEDGIRSLVRSRGLGDVYKRQQSDSAFAARNMREPKSQG